MLFKPLLVKKQMSYKKIKEKIVSFFRWVLYSEDPLSYVVFFIIAYLIYNYIIMPILVFITGSQAPMLVILTPSMEHTYFNLQWYCQWWNLSYPECQKKWNQLPFHNGINVGDLVISTSPTNAKVGDVIVARVSNLNFPLVHRVVGLQCNNTTIKAEVYLKDYPNCRILTKGDNNPIIDPYIIYYKDVEGTVTYVIPYIGLPRVIIYNIFHI